MMDLHPSRYRLCQFICNKFNNKIEQKDGDFRQPVWSQHIYSRLTLEHTTLLLKDQSWLSNQSSINIDPPEDPNLSLGNNLVRNNCKVQHQCFQFLQKLIATYLGNNLNCERQYPIFSDLRRHYHPEVITLLFLIAKTKISTAITYIT